MTNHVHLVAIPQRPDSLAQTLGNTHQLHAQRFNRRYGRSGHAWQNRSFSCPLGPDRTAVALAYCDLNPVRAGLVGRADNWPWSSALAHLTQRDDIGMLDIEACRRACDLEQWRNVLETGGFTAEGAALRRATLMGRAYGDESFVERIERESETDRPSGGGSCLKKKLSPLAVPLAPLWPVPFGPLAPGPVCVARSRR